VLKVSTARKVRPLELKKYVQLVIIALFNLLNPRLAMRVTTALVKETFHHLHYAITVFTVKISTSLQIIFQTLVQRETTVITHQRQQPQFLVQPEPLEISLALLMLSHVQHVHRVMFAHLVLQTRTRKTAGEDFIVKKELPLSLTISLAPKDFTVQMKTLVIQYHVLQAISQYPNNNTNAVLAKREIIVPFTGQAVRNLVNLDTPVPKVQSNHQHVQPENLNKAVTVDHVLSENTAHQKLCTPI